MSEREYAPLSGACVRGLCDKLYEKRKFAGAEIEKMVKDFNDANNTNQLKRLLRVLGQDLISTSNPNIKNGALMGLSSVAVGLGKDSVLYLSELINPIIACFSDSDSRVKYQAAEAMFNVVKIVRGSILGHFPVIFDALSKLATDPETQVKQGAELLDRLIKDIVTESPSFDLAVFIPLLRDRIYTKDPFGRQFIISWISVLDAVPDIDMIIYLPEILDGLFKMLDDNKTEIKRMCDIQLNEFLRSITKNPSRVDFSAMINILITHSQLSEEMLQLTAIKWIKEFVELSNIEMLPYLSGILTAVLPCLSYNEESKRNIKETAAVVNFQLTKLLSPNASTDAVPEETVEKIDLSSLVEVLSQFLNHSPVQTKVAALKWILHLYNKIPNKMFNHTEKLFDGLLRSLTDNSDDVVTQSLAVFAEICTCQKHAKIEDSEYYYTFMKALLRLLAADEALLEDRGAFIIRQLCILMNAEDIYKALANIMQNERNLRFVSTMVDVLNTILLTSAELYDLRMQLKNFNNTDMHNLFVCLYESWCHSPVSLVALSLLTHNYHHANQLIAHFGDLEITVDFLTEVDKLVQLIESPIFAYLRLELLSGDECECLRSALYGLLMLLPQTEAFNTLRRRLQCVPAHITKLTKSRTLQRVECKINFNELLDLFLKTQAAQREFRLTTRTKNLSLFDRGYS